MHPTEKTVNISLEPQSGETVLFFSVDDRSNPNCKFRQLLGLDREGMAICDLIVFYAQGSKRIICFVELKRSGNLGQAVRQVTNTYKFFRQFMNQSDRRYEFTAKAFIKLGGSLPQEYSKYKDELKQVFGADNYEHNGRSTELGDFLRGIARQPKGKRKKRRS